MSERLITKVENNGIIHYITQSLSEPRFEVQGTLSASHIVGSSDIVDGFENSFIRVVAPSGSAVYSSISESLSNLGSVISIEIRPGYYYEDPFTVPQGIRLIAPAGGVFVNANNSSVDFITLMPSSYLSNVEINGPVNASSIVIPTTSPLPVFAHEIRVSGSKIGFNISGNGVLASLDDSRVVGCLTGSVIGSFSSASFTKVDFVDNVNQHIIANGFSRLDSVRIFNLATINTTSVGITIGDGANLNFSNLNIQNLNLGLFSNSPNRTITGNSLEFTDVRTPVTILSGSGSILVSNVVGDLSRVTFQQSTKTGVTAFDTKTGEETFRTLADLSVGSFRQGNVFSTGESGQSSAILCFSSSSLGVWVDETANARDFAGGALTFPGTSSNDSLYFALNISKSNGIGQHIYGLNFTLNNTASYGSGSYIEWETWNGTTWAHVHSMATQFGDGYYDLNTGSFDRYTSQTVRFNQNIIAQSVSKSLDGITFSSSSQYWVRARITGALNALPSIQTIKPFSNASTFGPDGFLTFHGGARNNRTFPWSIIGTEKNFTATPTDQTLGIGDNLSVGFKQNVLPDGSDRQIGFTNAMPLELDTSTQASVRFSFRPDTTAAGNIVFKVRYSYSADTDTVYETAAAAPTIALREYVTAVTASGPFTAGSVKTVFASIFLEGFPTRQEGLGLSPVMWVTLERTGTDVNDTYTGAVQLFDVSGRYTSWCLGGHAAFFT